MINEKKTSQIFTPGYDGPLVSLSLFNELQHNILSTDILENAYKDYKTKYEQKRFHSFYVEHQTDEWFKEKYDPELSVKWKNERNLQCQKLAHKFFNTKFDKLKLELREVDENNKNIKILTYGYNKDRQEFEEKERDIAILSNNKDDLNSSNLDISSSPYYGFDPDKMTLFLHQIPRNVSRFAILDIVKKLPGFISMSLSEPIKNQNYYRYCWVTFDSEENTELAFETLNEYRISSDYKILPIKSKSTTIKRVRITPPYFEDRILEDLELTRSFIMMYDKDKMIEGNEILNSNSNLNLKVGESEDSENLAVSGSGLVSETNGNGNVNGGQNKSIPNPNANTNTNSNTNSNLKSLSENIHQLDLQILYLRRVHGFSYYCLEDHEDERALATKCDNIHLRNYKMLGARDSSNLSEGANGNASSGSANVNPNNNLSDSNNSYEALWDKNFTLLAKAKLEKGIDSSKTVSGITFLYYRVHKFKRREAREERSFVRRILRL